MQPFMRLAQHSLEIGDPGNGSLTATCIPALPRLLSTSGNSLQPPEASSLDGVSVVHEPEDVLGVSAEALLLRAAAANATVQLGMLQAEYQH